MESVESPIEKRQLNWRRHMVRISETSSKRGIGKVKKKGRG